jgi:hypothetical protein
LEIIKRIINWNYERASWQWDVLCVVCLIFIFLTPKAWFERREKLATQTSRLIVKADDFSTEKTALENKVKELSGNPNAEIIEWREKKDKQGNIFYEIDIR